MQLACMCPPGSPRPFPEVSTGRQMAPDVSRRHGQRDPRTHARLQALRSIVTLADGQAAVGRFWLLSQPKNATTCGSPSIR